MKLRSLIKRTIAFLLCVCMLLPFSLSSNAASGDAGKDTVSVAESPAASIAPTDELTMKADSTATLKPETGMEVISLREENVKHFDMGNDTYQAIAYSHPVHEKDSEGNWQDIDFTMNLTQTRGVSTYTNTTGTAFAANYVANQPIMSIGSADTTITMTLLPNVNAETMHTQTTAGTTTVQAQRTATQTQIQTYTDAQAASFSNTLLYENVMPGIDLEYIVDPWTVKENIIVNQRA